MKLLRISVVVGLMVGAGIANAQTETTLYSFVGSPDGSYPEAGLVQGTDGNFYGTAMEGGTYNSGTVFRVSSSGTYTVLHSFGVSPSDGATPTSALVLGGDGNFYGTTAGGGTTGYGTVYRISPYGSYTNLYSFASFAIGAYPVYDGLVLGTDGNFYGATANGGFPGGTVYRISPSGNQTTLYYFGSQNYDGSYPEGNLMQASDGAFYGTTTKGGTNGVGTVFRITAGGSYTNLYSFGSVPNDGNTPQGGLVQGSDGNFYGTTTLGGTYSGGTVFKISPSGTETTLYSFVGYPVDGSNPNWAGLVQGSDGNFYGTTANGGTTGHGTVFRISPSGSYTSLYSFASSPSDGNGPYACLVQGSDGNLYGTTAGGGTNNVGTVFKLTIPQGPTSNQISGIQLLAPNVILTIPSIAGRTYQLQSRNSLTSGSWSNVPGAAVTNSIGGLLTLTDSGGALQSQAFYRVTVSTGGTPLPAADNAADPAYSGGWTNGSNGGTGFGPWTLTASGVIGSSTNGFFVGSSTNNAGGSTPGIDTSGKSWGDYANLNNYTAAYRAFTNGSLAVGQSLLISMDNGYINTGQTDGFVLRNGNANSTFNNYNTGERFEFLYLGGDSSNSYKVVDSTGQHNIGTGYTSTGKRLVFTLTGTDTYTLLTIDNAAGTTNTFSGTLGGTLGTTVDSIAIYNRNAGAGPNYDAFFNSLQIIGP